MNNKFVFNRFVDVLALDGKKYVRNFGITFAVLCSLNTGLWLLSAFFGFSMPVMVRWMVIYVAVFLSAILVPAKAFGDINLQREGVRFAMLPASNLEKYLSYVLYCLLTPFAVALVSYGLDALLTLLPVGGFDDYIRHLGFLGATSDFLNDMNVPSSDLAGFDTMISRLGSLESWNYLVGILFCAALFMFGNLLFKTHKTGKTFGIMIGFNYALSMVLQTLVLATNFRTLFPGPLSIGPFGIHPDPNSVDFGAIGDFATGSMAVTVIFYILLAIGLYLGIYFKLKNQKY